MKWGKIFSTIYTAIAIYGAGIIVADLIMFLIDLLKGKKR